MRDPAFVPSTSGNLRPLVDARPVASIYLNLQWQCLLCPVYYMLTITALRKAELSSQTGSEQDQQGFNFLPPLRLSSFSSSPTL